MAVIGVIDIAMKASVEPFLQGMKKASASLGGFAKSAASFTVSKVGEGLSAIGGPARTVIGHLTGLKAAVLGLAGVATFTALTTSSLHAIDATGELAEKLGVTGGALDAFKHAAQFTGGPVEQLPEILGRLNSQLGLAARGSGPAAEGLKRLNLDAKSLSQAGPIEALKTIADGLNKIESPAERAAISVQIFGEQGSKLAATLKAGSSGINKLEEEARKLGVALNETSYAKAANAVDALDRAGGVISGLGKDIAIELAPYIEAAANKFVELATEGEGLGPKVRAGVEMVKSAIGTAADGVHKLRIGFGYLQLAATKATAAAVYGLDSMGKAADVLVPGLKFAKDQLLGTGKEVGPALDQLAKEQAASLDELMKAPPPSQGIEGFFHGIEHAADASANAVNNATTSVKGMGDAMGDAAFKVAELEKKLKDELATVGMTSAQVEVYKLRQAGASEADIERVGTLAAQLKAAEKAQKEFEKLNEDSKKLAEDTKTPLEKFETDVAKIRQMYANGFIDEDTMKRGIEKATKDSGLDTGEKRAGALELGSKEARSSILNFKAQQAGGSTVDEAVKKTTANTSGILTAAGQLVVLTRQLVANAGSEASI